MAGQSKSVPRKPKARPLRPTCRPQLPTQRGRRRAERLKAPLKTHCGFLPLKGRGVVSFERCRNQADRVKTPELVTEAMTDHAGLRFSRVPARNRAGGVWDGTGRPPRPG